MTEQEFYRHIDKTLDELIEYAELHADKELPKDLIFEWGIRSKTSVVGRIQIIEELCSKIYISPEKIYPCVDITVDGITEEGKLKILGQIAGFEPRPYQTGGTGRPGPFIYVVNSTIISKNINTKDDSFRKKLRDKGLIFISRSI